MKILVTGATGFVGSKVITRLAKKYSNDDIVALSSKKISGVKTVDSKQYNFDKNYLVENGCEGVDCLLHIGAFTPKSSADANEIDSSTSNITNTIRLLEALPDLTKIVFTSTIDVYEETDGIISETTPTIPFAMYGWSKLYCEQVVKTYSVQMDLTYEILRLGHVYGEGEEIYKKAMPSMIANAIRGEDLTIYGDGKAVRSFIHIDDVVNAIVKSIELNTSEIINVVSTESITISELAEKIKMLSSSKVNITYVPSEIKNRDYIFDNLLLREKLIDEFVPFDEGLKREYKYMEGKLLG